MCHINANLFVLNRMRMILRVFKVSFLSVKYQQSIILSLRCIFLSLLFFAIQTRFSEAFLCEEK